MKKRTKISLPLLVAIYILILLGVGLSPIPKIIYPIGMFLGFFTFYLYFTIPPKNKLMVDIGLFLIPILGGSAGSLLLWIACKLLTRSVCQVSSFKAQVFGNIAFPLLIVFWLWIVQRLASLLRKK